MAMRTCKIRELAGAVSVVPFRNLPLQTTVVIGGCAFSGLSLGEEPKTDRVKTKIVRLRSFDGLPHTSQSVPCEFPPNCAPRCGVLAEF